MSVSDVLCPEAIDVVASKTREHFHLCLQNIGSLIHQAINSSETTRHLTWPFNLEKRRPTSIRGRTGSQALKEEK